MVEGIDAEVVAAGLAKNKVLQLLQASFWVLLWVLAHRVTVHAYLHWCMRSRLGPPMTSPFGARSCCTRLQHPMIVLL